MLTATMFLSIPLIMLAIGIYGLVSRRNMVRMLLSAEVIFNAALLALLTLSSIPLYAATQLDKPAIGGTIALLAIGIAAAEIGVAISIAILLFQIKQHIDVYELKKFRG
ncbi:MAG: NADH-quinone oxidoreductase subunit NuoK [Nitrososphaerota archaeon]|nr:NADH-quinone oxidoreductase subunit NuoK [Nitrososphaerales archaeon]MDW8044363.1 NADH-quinone oxidoreductase subunit NuoK [Nitrososphaerota archaeon]